MEDIAFMEEINNNHNGSGIAIKYRLVGQVQGVGFRHYLLEKAQAQGIIGWAQNECDGSLTVLLVGNDDAVSGMVLKLKEGPALANVVNMTELMLENGDLSAPADFSIR